MSDKPAGKAAGYFQSPEALRRLKRRRRAEARLRAYGIAAIAIAVLALVALLSSVISKAGGAVTESYLTLPVRLEAKVIDPEGTKLLDRHRDGRLDLRAHAIAQASAVIVKLFGLHADQKQAPGRIAHHLGHGKHFLKACLMQADLLAAHELGHLVILDPPDGAGGQAVIHRIEHDQHIRIAHVLNEIDALRAAIHELDIFGKYIAAVHLLDRPHAEAFIGPQEIADTENQNPGLLGQDHLPRLAHSILRLSPRWGGLLPGRAEMDQ